MKDQSKTKQVLIQELASLRERITELEQSESERKQPDKVLHIESEILANMMEGVHLTRADNGIIVYANSRFESMFGYDSGELLGKHVSIVNASGEKSPEDVANEITKTLKQTGIWKGEVHNIKKDGTSFWCYANVSKFMHLQYGEVWISVHQDITRRKQAEKLLHRAEENFRHSLEDLPLGVRIVNMEGETIYANRAILDIYSLDELKAISPVNFYTPECYTESQIRREKRKRGDDAPSEYQIKIIGKDGEVRHLQVFRKEILWNGERQFQVLYNDITERKQMEEKLRTSRLQLRALAVRLQKIREEERLMVSREIHDEMGGGLTGLKMDLSWLLGKMGDADPGEERVALMDRIQTANTLIDQMIRVVRRISTDLRPPVLDDLGLVAALEWQLSEFTSRTEIAHEFATTFEYVNMEADTAVAVFRIFQEALTNVVRHARATKIVVVLREDERTLSGDENLVLEISDNGRGITEAEILNLESLGLLGMKERVLAFGGELSICGEPGGGTALVLKIPRKQREAS